MSGRGRAGGPSSAVSAAMAGLASEDWFAGPQSGRLAISGRVNLSTAGRSICTGTVVVKSNTAVNISPIAELYAAAGRSQPLFIAEYAGFLHPANLMVRSGGIVTVTETNTWRKVGQTLFISGGPDATFRGVVTISAVTSAGYSYASAGSDGVAGAVTSYYNVIPVRRQILAASFLSIGGGYVDVTDPGHDLTAGDLVYLGNAAGSVFAPGQVKVTRADAIRWTYFATGATGSASGTFVVSYDKNITFKGGGRINGNRLGCTPDAGCDMRLVTVWLGCTIGARFDTPIGGSPMRAVNVMNCADVSLGPNSAFFDSLVGLQAEGGCDGFVADQSRHGSSEMEAGYPQPVTISSATNSGTTAVVNTATPHGLDSGSPVTVTGMTPAAYNVSPAQIIVASATQFRYPMASNPGGNATVVGSYTVGQQADDYVAFTGVANAAGAGGNYDSTVSPYGLTYFAGIDVRSLNIGNALNAVKLTAMSTCPFRGTTRVGRIYARMSDNAPQKGLGGGVRFIDDGPGLVGTTMDRLQIDGPIEFAGTTAANVTAIALQLSGTGSIGQISGRGINGEIGASSILSMSGVTVQHLDMDASRYAAMGANKIPYQFLGGTVRKFSVRNSAGKVGTSQPIAYLGGGTVNDIEFNGFLAEGAAANTGQLIDYAVAAGLRSVTFRGVKTPVGGTSIGTLMAIQNIAVGTIDIFLEDIDVNSSTLLTTPNTGGSGTFNIHLGPRVAWTATGSNNAIQFGFGTVNIYGVPGVSLPTDKLVLFGYGAPTYRIDMPSPLAGANFNSGNYIGAQIVPVNGDIVYNTNAGALVVGKIVRRAGAWTAL